jgi:hypothetical protein
MAKVNRFTFRYNFSKAPGQGKPPTRSRKPLKSTVSRNGNFREKIRPYKEGGRQQKQKLDFEAKSASFR